MSIIDFNPTGGFWNSYYTYKCFNGIGVKNEISNDGERQGC